MKNEFDLESLCPCGSGKEFGACCGRYIGGVPAPTAEALMRSRYTAYFLGDEAYLRHTWHSATRPESVDIQNGPEWTGLEIRSTGAGGEPDEHGLVEFVARYVADGRPGALHESSRFLREDGRWVYVDGEIHRSPGQGEKVGRNAPCPCGSGRKFKRCCGR